MTYDPMSHQWSELHTSGETPAPTLSPSSVASADDGCLYVYGGIEQVEHFGYLMMQTSSNFYSLGIVKLYLSLFSLSLRERES